MIDSRQLRIGNWVYSKSHNWNYKVILLEYDKELNVEPIPLTEEILLKCGFEKSNDLDKFYHLDLLNEWTRIYFNPKHKVCTLSINQHDSRISIQYLHELQNLVFSLTQKELKIQL